MISHEAFEYFQRLGIHSPALINYDDMQPIVREMSVETMSNWQLEESDADDFWSRIDQINNEDHVQSIYFEVVDLFTEESDDDDLSDEELFEMSQDAFIKAIYIVTNVSDDAMEAAIEGMGKRFFCEIFKADNPQDLDVEMEAGDKVWCIIWNG